MIVLILQHLFTVDLRIKAIIFAVTIEPYYIFMPANIMLRNNLEILYRQGDPNVVWELKKCHHSLCLGVKT